MCDQTVNKDSSSLQFVPDWFVTREGLYMWHDDYYYDDGGHWDDDDEEDNFLRGTLATKNARLRRQRLRKNFYPSPGIHQDSGIGVCQAMRNKI